MCRLEPSNTHYTAFPGTSSPRPIEVRGLARRLPDTLIVWVIAAINFAVYLAMEAAGGSSNPRVLGNYGAKVNVLIAHGEYWRLLTSAFLHIGLTHLLFNMFALLSFGRMV